MNNNIDDFRHVLTAAHCLNSKIDHVILGVIIKYKKYLVKLILSKTETILSKHPHKESVMQDNVSITFSTICTTFLI